MMSALKTFVVAALLVASAARAEQAPPDAHAAKAIALLQEAEAELKLSAATNKTGGHFVTAGSQIRGASYSIKSGWSAYARGEAEKQNREAAKARAAAHTDHAEHAAEKK